MSLKAIFNAGPAALPEQVFSWLRTQIPDAKDRFESVLEIGHRTPEFMGILEPLKENIRKLYQLPQDFEVTFLQGGANMQFGAIPANFRKHPKPPVYIQTGRWSERALEDAQRMLNARRIWNGEDVQYLDLPSAEQINKILHDHSYLYFTTNETVHGLQLHENFWQNLNSDALVADMSSDVLTRPIDFKKFALVFACAQKNLGIAGVTMLITRKNFVEQMNADDLPRMLDLKLQIAENSCFNTPPVLAIAVARVVAEWTLATFKTLENAQKINQQKAKAVYDAIENSNGFYVCNITPKARSLVNAVFRIADAKLEEKFIADAKKEGFIGMKGHKVFGGLRVSMYNATSLTQVQSFVDFMKHFQSKLG